MGAEAVGAGSFLGVGEAWPTGFGRRAVEHDEGEERAGHGCQRAADGREDRRRLAPPRNAGGLDTRADPRSEVTWRSDVSQPGHHPALVGEGGKGLAALVAAVEVCVEAAALVLREVTIERRADQLLERLVAVHRHRAKPSSANARRISPRARQSSVRTAP